MKLTDHATERCQQRAISEMQLDLLIQFGKRISAGHGTTKVYIDKAARKRIKAYAGAFAGRLYEFLDIYAVLDNEDRVITTSHLTKRIRHA